MPSQTISTPPTHPKPDSALSEPGSSATSWHALTADEALSQRGATPEGLTADEARRRLESFGPNEMPRARGDGPLQLLWRQINNPMIWVLIASGGVAIVVDPVEGLKNGLVILGVVTLNTLIGFVQEYRAGKAIEALSRMVPENVTALRDGRKVDMPAAGLVPGDIVLLASGDKVPADVRLLTARSLRVEEAALTGESVPTEKSTAPVEADAPLGDRTNMAFGGTLVTQGAATALVVATGGRTELGRISKMLDEATDLETPLTRALGVIGRYITVAIVVVAVLMLAVGAAREVASTGVGLVEALRAQVIFAIALAVGAIPEGLPAIVTIALAIGVQRMAARRAVIRKLPAVETLGSTTVICSDKTGTLTRNEMTVQALWTPAGGGVTVTGVGYDPKGEFKSPGGDALARVEGPARDLLVAGALCNDATLRRTPAGAWEVTGDPTEAALLAAAEKAGLEVEALRRDHPRVDAIPFESENQFMATLNDLEGGRRVLLKGAPEVVLRRCADVDAGAVLREVERLAGEGMRVLAFARKAGAGVGDDLTNAHAEGGFELLGLQGMIDPPRSEAIEAIRACHAAGITVKMITGDHRATAAAIGRQLGLLTEGGALTGAQLAEMDDARLQEAALGTNVFARVAPEHKLKLVRALQARGHVVAMTGDGVNDAPALKQSDVGVAMGITGTAVSKESADVVLTDDNFASIAAAVEEGRRVYDNLIKSLAFVLPTNLGLAMILMAAVAFFPFGDVTRVVDGVAVTGKELLLPILPTQLLWINLVATVALALPLAFESKEPDVMRRKPRRPDEPVLGAFLLKRTVVAAVLMAASAVALFLYEYLGERGRGVAAPVALAEAQSMAVTSVIFFQIFYLLHCRSLKGSLLAIGVFSNWTVFAGIGGVLLLQAAFLYAPIMNRVFGSAPLTPVDLLESVAAAAVILPVISVEKWHRNRAR